MYVIYHLKAKNSNVRRRFFKWLSNAIYVEIGSGDLSDGRHDARLVDD